MNASIFHRGTLALLGVALAAGFAGAQDVKTCRSEARHEFRSCKRTCRDGLRAAKDTCSKRDHECVDACRVDLAACRAPFEAELAAAVAECDATLKDAKRACRAEFPDGSAERDRCIDQAQGVAFACRDAAREAVAPDLHACKRAFKSCVETTCPPEAPVDPATFHACRADARDVFKRCVAGCREDFQLAKDTCLNRDHDCVEGCRQTRSDCRAPLVATFEEALAVCAADRAAAIDVCRSLYEADTPQRDTCVDQAQLAAFGCRDDAREAVKPGLRLCRNAFRDCAVACPPPGGSPSGAFLR